MVGSGSAGQSVGTMLKLPSYVSQTFPRIVAARSGSVVLVVHMLLMHPMTSLGAIVE